MTGMKVLEQSNDSNSIDISKLSSGMYQIICNFKDGNRAVNSFVKI